MDQAWAAAPQAHRVGHPVAGGRCAALLIRGVVHDGGPAAADLEHHLLWPDSLSSTAHS